MGAGRQDGVLTAVKHLVVTLGPPPPEHPTPTQLPALQTRILMEVIARRTVLAGLGAERQRGQLEVQLPIHMQREEIPEFAQVRHQVVLVRQHRGVLPRMSGVRRIADG